MQPFIYTGLPARVVFGSGTTAQLPDEVEALGINRALVLTTPPQEGQGQDLAAMLEGKAAGVFSGAAMHTPVATTEAALRVFDETGADGIVAIGGGSTIGLGKAIALRNDAPQVVVPTTYAGSEMTPIVGQTEDGKKTTLRSLKVLPETVIYDVDHTLSLPPQMTVTSGMNAIAHAVEALYAQNANPVLSMMAEEGVARMVAALQQMQNAPTDIGARSDAFYGAWLCAVCLGAGGVALHHKLCHVLGGSFGLPHAETHTAVLPHALVYNAGVVPETMAALRRATASNTPAATFFDLGISGGAPMSLKELGMPREGIEKAIQITLENPYFNPRDLEPEALQRVLENAWHGRPPHCN